MGLISPSCGNIRHSSSRRLSGEELRVPGARKQFGNAVLSLELELELELELYPGSVKALLHGTL